MRGCRTARCPFVSNNAPDRRAVLVTFLLSILAGHHRYAHITGIRKDSIHPKPRGRHARSSGCGAPGPVRIDESVGLVWLNRHPGKTAQPLPDTPRILILDPDTTVKRLYEKQEGAMVGYTPISPDAPRIAITTP